MNNDLLRRIRLRADTAPTHDKRERAERDAAYVEHLEAIRDAARKRIEHLEAIRDAARAFCAASITTANDSYNRLHALLDSDPPP